MPRTLSFLVLLFSLISTPAAHAQAVSRPDSAAKAPNNRSGAWSATTASGAPLIGTWTAVFDTTTGTVTGSWTLVDAQGRTLANGAWSAAKSASQWNGAWRAVIAGRDGEYSGTWTARADLKSNARLVEMFAKAIQAVVSGTWRMGRQSGAWSIRASP